MQEQQTAAEDLIVSEQESVSRQKVLVIITADPACRKAIEIAMKRSRTDQAEFIGLFIETAYLSSLTLDQKKMLDKNIEYARQCGASVSKLYGTDPAYLIEEFCNSSRITTLVMTRAPRIRWYDQFRRSLSRELTNRLPDTTIILIPGGTYVRRDSLSLMDSSPRQFWLDLGKLLLVLIGVTILCTFFDQKGADDGILAPFYIFGAVLIAITTNRWYWPVIGAVLSIGIFDVIFAEPRFVFHYEHRELTVVFLITFFISLISGLLTQRMHAQSKLARQSSWRTQTLLDTSVLLQTIKDPREIPAALCRKLSDLAELDLVYYPSSDGVLLDPQLFRKNRNSKATPSEARTEKRAAEHAFKTLRETGATTADFPGCPYFFVPWTTGTIEEDRWVDQNLNPFEAAAQPSHGVLPFASKKRRSDRHYDFETEESVSDHVYGVIGFRIGKGTFSDLEKLIVENILRQGANTMESRQNELQILEDQRQAESAKQRTNILKAVSHDIRTPLTSIVGNVAALKENQGQMTLEERAAVYNALSQDTMALGGMVENLLTTARLENNALPLHNAPEMLSDVIDAALEQPMKANRTHPIEVELEDEFLMAAMDSTLIMQAISNMVMNAIHHTPDGTPITVVLRQEGHQAVVEVRDTGPGISDEMKPRIFDLFYTGNDTTIDSNHFLGLGLYLCKAIIDNHQGEIGVKDNTPHGAIFYFKLPLVELN